VILIRPEKQDITSNERYAAKRFAANIATLCKEQKWEHYPCLLDGIENGISSESATLSAIASLYPSRKDEEHEFYLIDDGHQHAFFAEADHINLHHFKFDWRDELKRKEAKAESINTSARMFRDRYEFALVTMTAALTVATVVTSINNLKR
jgi:hypothetical protein